tara:strand:+ start:3076 stop:3336 length:261 start_codon:yes stop_codon:yes gene_type:complete
LNQFKPIIKKDEIKVLKTLTKKLSELHDKTRAIDLELGKILTPYVKKIKTKKERDNLIEDIKKNAPHNSMGIVYLITKLSQKEYKN